MKCAVSLAVAVLSIAPVLALDGDVGTHDPSTVIVENGRFYSYGTGAGLSTGARAKCYFVVRL